MTSATARVRTLVSRPSVSVQFWCDYYHPTLSTANCQHITDVPEGEWYVSPFPFSLFLIVVLSLLRKIFTPVCNENAVSTLTILCIMINQALRRVSVQRPPWSEGQSPWRNSSLPNQLPILPPFKFAIRTDTARDYAWCRTFCFLYEPSLILRKNELVDFHVQIFIFRRQPRPTLNLGMSFRVPGSLKPA